MNRTYLLIGGNVGDRFKNLEKARQLVGSKAGKIVQQSALYETAAWGMQDQPAFLNQVLVVDTVLDPEALLDTILGVEKEMGRERLEKYGPRTIDIDILLFNDLVVETDRLTVPHPQMHQRRFALAPLADVAAATIHPVLKKSIDELLLECPDKLPVKKL
ncbi:MAG TPA: 2-amino-4-hydroxy-6-hydroxymethyldihydropteridine diphosphokinase [Chitinophagaceae bacterium]|nr:2-amino-4-hydroxy-6-hydroxymethyldihydropteridine diphosphokinase [Chitinophagaceae bacterium]